jgi:hypothetical protein
MSIQVFLSMGPDLVLLSFELIPICFVVEKNIEYWVLTWRDNFWLPQALRPLLGPLYTPAFTRALQESPVPKP